MTSTELDENGYITVDFEQELTEVLTSTEQTYDIFSWVTQLDPSAWIDALQIKDLPVKEELLERLQNDLAND